MILFFIETNTRTNHNVLNVGMEDIEKERERVKWVLLIRY
jgi:hypothetical protein